MANAVTTNAAGEKLKKNSNNAKAMQRRVFYVLMLPYIIMTVLVKGVPFVWGIVMSFSNYTGFNMASLKFVGFNNYIRVFTDNDATASLLRTFGIGIILVPLTMAICLIMSLLLNNCIRGVGMFRTIFYIPSIVPSIAATMIWLGIFEKSGGMLNEIRALFNFGVIDWLSYDNVKGSLIFMMCWGAGGGILVNIAAMKCISGELYEAADLEGANVFVKTFKITLPLISNMIYMNLITGMIGILQMFGEPVLLTGSGSLTAVPKRPVYTYLVHVYQQIFANLRFGYGLAMLWIIFIIIIVITMFAEKTSKFWVYNEVQ